LGHRHPLVRAIIGVALVLLIGTVGYRFIEGWSLLDGFYMTVITITTIGFTEVHTLNLAGKIFTLFIIFTGIGMVGYAFLAGTQLVIEGEINKILTRRRSMKAIEKLKDHFIICGYGRMGSFVCEQLHARGIPFVVVENKVEVQDKVVQAGHYLSPGDATEEEVLLAASIKTARGLVSVLNSDAANVYVVLTARELNPPLEIIARAAEESAQSRLLRAGATRVISPYQIGGMRMVMGIVKPAVMDFLQVAMDHKEMNVDLTEVRVAENSMYSGKKLIETDLRKELNLIIIAIKKSDGRMEFNPGPNTVIQSNDTLITMGKRQDLEVFENKAGVGS
jgi:voltage-gated potassium channel